MSNQVPLPIGFCSNKYLWLQLNTSWTWKDQNQMLVGVCGCVTWSNRSFREKGVQQTVSWWRSRCKVELAFCYGIFLLCCLWKTRVKRMSGGFHHIGQDVCQSHKTHWTHIQSFTVIFSDYINVLASEDGGTQQLFLCSVSCHLCYSAGPPVTPPYVPLSYYLLFSHCCISCWVPPPPLRDLLIWWRRTDRW